MLRKFFISLLLVVPLTSVLGTIAYFNRPPVFECYSGDVQVTEDNINLLKNDSPGSCSSLNLTKVSCDDTYGCFVNSTRPSQAPEIGDTLSFGCGELEPCNEEPGFNCCTDNK